jgi:hypothetical protein
MFFVPTISPWATLRSLAIYGNPAIYNYDKPYGYVSAYAAVERGRIEKSVSLKLNVIT